MAKTAIMLSLAIFILGIPSLYANQLSVDALSPSSINLCGMYPQNVSVTAINIKNNGNQTLENITATLLADPSNGLSIVNSSLQLGTLAPNASSFNPSWQVQCADKPGMYTLYLGFSNPNGDLGSSLGQATSIVTVYANDLIAPAVQSHSPSGVIPTPYVNLEVITNEEATCKYSTIPNVAYANQQFSFQITGGFSHKASLQDLGDNWYNFYVRCKDLAGNEASSDYKMSIEINAPPTAALKLSKTPPLREGTTEVTVTTSEPVKPVPSLSYACDGNTVAVPLSGSGTSWKGYIIIDQPNSNEVCSFSFSANDLSGNPGTFITGGNLFLVDTQPPAAPTALTVSERKGPSVKLNWKYHLDDAVQFTIYRLGEDDTSLYPYEISTQTTFIDGNVASGETYYYSVSATDKAGNEGPLSVEMSVAIQGNFINEAGSSAGSKNNGNNESTAKKAEPVLSNQKIDLVIANLDKLLEEINTIRPELKEKNEEFPLLMLLNRIKEGKSSLLKKKDELGKLKDSDFSNPDNVERFEKTKSEIEQIKRNIITSVSAKNKQTIHQKENEIMPVLTSFLEKKGITKEKREGYLLTVQKLQAKVKIITAAQEIELSHLDGTTKTLLQVEKEITINDPDLSGATIVEYIPKTVASSVTEMLLEKQVQILEKDPLFSYTVNGNHFTYSYMVNKELPPESIKDTVTVVVPSLPTAEEEGNRLTGLAIFSYAEDWSRYDVGIALGLLLIVGILVYSSVYAEKKSPSAEQSNAHKKVVPGLVAQFYTKIKNKRKDTEIESTASAEIKNTEEVLYPHYALKEYKTAGLTSLKDATLAALLGKVDDTINKLDYDRTVKLYHFLCTHRDFSSLKNNKLLERVGKKITLLTKQELLKASLDQEDYLNLRYLLNEVADLYNGVIPDASEKERNFLDFIKESHDRYSRLLLGGKK